MGGTIRAALGFRVKSGWAMAVLLCGTRKQPRLAACQEVLLSDPRVPGTKQPYHAGLEKPAKEASLVIRKLCKAVKAAADKSISETLKQAAAEGYAVRKARCVVGSLVDPATLHNEHIRAHGLEGQLFRAALEDALAKHKIACSAMVEKGAYEAASEVLQISVGQLKQRMARLGESRDGAWRAEEKLAALAAWIELS